MKVIWWILRGLLPIAALICGCDRGHFYAAYGVPPAPHDPTVTLDDFSYTPASPVSPGDTLEFTATLNKPTNEGEVIVRIGDPPLYSVFLNDYGVGADYIAGDGVWHGELELPLDATANQGLPTLAHLHWWDGDEGQSLSGENLTIEEEDE